MMKKIHALHIGSYRERMDIKGLFIFGRCGGERRKVNYWRAVGLMYLKNRKRYC